MEILIDKVNNSTAVLRVKGFKRHYGTHPKYFVNSSLTFYEEGYQFTYKYKHNLSSGKKSLFNNSESTFPMGLVPKIYKSLNENYPDASVAISPHILSSYQRPGGKANNEEISEFIESLGLPYEVRDYQFDMIKTSINKRRRALSACTGSGKSLVIYVLARWLLQKEDTDVLVIVPSMSLVEQIYGDFKEYGWDDIEHYCSRLHSDIKKPSKAEREEMKKYNILPDHLLKRVVVSTWQSLAHKPADFYRRFGAVICDEAHSAQADILSNIIYGCKNADLRIGLSGTIPDNGLNAHVITGCLGPTQVVVTTADLIERGILTKTEIIALKIPYDDRSKKIVKKFKYAEEVEATSLCGSSEKVIVTLLDKKKITLKENTIILVKHIELLDRIYNIIEEQFPEFKVVKYHGAVKVGERERIRAEVEKDSGHILVCTYGTMKQGVNIKRINNIIFGQGSSSLVTVKQSIGRGLRLHSEKPILRIYDIVDDLRSVARTKEHINYAYRHYLERLGYYNQDKYPITEYILNFTASFDDIKIE